MSEKKAWEKFVAGLRGMDVYPFATRSGNGYELELCDNKTGRISAVIPIPMSRRTPVGMLRALRERGYLK